MCVGVITLSIRRVVQTFDEKNTGGALAAMGFLQGDVITHINMSEATPDYVKYVNDQAYSAAVSYSYTE